MWDDRWCLDRAPRRTGTNRELLGAAARQAGRISSEQLGWLGWSTDQVDRRVRSGLLTSRSPGVYAVGPVLESPLARAWEALLAVGGDAALTGTWGCWRHGLLRAPSGAPEVATTSQRGRKLPGVRTRRRSALLERDVVVLDGLRVLSPAACLLDLSRHHPASLPKALNEAQRALVHVGDLRALARGKPGARALTQALDAYDPREERTREELERRALAMVVAAGAPVYEPNARVATDVREYEVDGLYAEQRIVVELQSEAHHSTPAERRADRVKANALTQAGHRLIQWDWHDVTRTPDVTVATLLALLDAE